MLVTASLSVNPSASALLISGAVSLARPYRSAINFSEQNGDCKISKIVFNYFVEDPSNIDENFKRIRIRKLINTLEDEGLDKNKLRITINNLKYANNAINFYYKNNLRKNSTYFKEKNTVILNKSFFSQPNEIIFRSFADVLKKITKKHYPPRGKSLIAVIMGIKSGKLKKTTLGGCIIKKISETVVVFPERS